MQPIALNAIPAGTRVKLNAISGGRNLTRRLLSLGINLDNEFEVMRQNGPGTVLARDGNRIALGSGIAEKLSVLAIKS